NVVVGGRGFGGGRGGPPPAAGVVHVFRLTAGTWKPVGELSSAAPFSGDGFGTALSAEGPVLLVGQVSPPPVAPVVAGRGAGAPQQPAGPPPPDTAVGSVQVFRRGADMKWTAAGTLVATRTGGAQFGS